MFGTMRRNGVDQATAFLIARSERSYRADLQTWIVQVERARDLGEALRIAARKPQPKPILRSIGGITGGARHTAETRVEAALMCKLDAEDLPVEERARLMRMAAGHWPGIHRKLEVRQRQAPGSFPHPERGSISDW